MRKSTKRFIISIVVLAVAAGAVMIGIRSYIFSISKNHIDKALTSLGERGIHIKYDSLYLDWRRNLILFENIVISKNNHDTTCVYPEFVSVGQLRLEGFGLLGMLFSNEVSFETVILNDPRVVLRQNSAFFSDSATNKGNLNLTIDDLRLIRAKVEYTDSLACNLLAAFDTDLYAVNTSLIIDPKNPLKPMVDKIRVQNTSIQLPTVFYNLTFKNAELDPKGASFQLDTLRIQPLLSKMEFGKTIGREIDRVEGVIPFLKLDGIKFKQHDSLSFTVAKTEIQGFVRFFRDKRLPLLKVFKPLPIDQMRKLPFAVTIDTLEVVKSFIEYEEFPEEGKGSGKVYFDDLRGKIVNLTNVEEADGETTIFATARFMGVSTLSMTTKFPLDRKRPSTTIGALENLDLTKLNPMLEALANINIESGNLEKLSFTLRYNATRADGEVTLNYSNLKMISFKDDEKVRKLKEKRKNKDKTPDELRKDNFKTFILNTFIIRKNMTDKLPDEKRTGTVLFYRDTNRSVFNYWWNAVFSGIKSAYNINSNNNENKK